MNKTKGSSNEAPPQSSHTAGNVTTHTATVTSTAGNIRVTSVASSYLTPHPGIFFSPWNFLLYQVPCDLSAYWRQQGNLIEALIEAVFSF